MDDKFNIGCYWVVTVTTWPEIRHRLWAKTRALAIYDQWMKAKDAGYKIKWTDFRARQDGVCE